MCVAFQTEYQEVRNLFNLANMMAEITISKYYQQFFFIVCVRFALTLLSLYVFTRFQGTPSPLSQCMYFFNDPLHVYINQVVQQKKLSLLSHHSKKEGRFPLHHLNVSLQYKEQYFILLVATSTLERNLVFSPRLDSKEIRYYFAEIE